MRNALNNMKLRDKLLLMHLLSVFIPIVVINVVFYNVTTANIRSQTYNDASMALNNLKNDLRVTIDQGAGFSYSLYADPTFNKTIAHHFSSQLEYVETYNSYLRGLLSDTNEQGIRWYDVYTDNATVLASGHLARLNEEIKSHDWYTRSLSAKSSYPSFVFSDRTFSLVQWLNNYQPGDIEQLIKVDLNMDLISQKFSSSAFNGSVYFVDPQGYVRFSSPYGVNPLYADLRFEEVLLPEKSMLFEADYSNVNYLEGWTLQGVMDEETVLQDVRKSRSFIIWLACLNFVLPTIIIVFVSRSLHVRLAEILKHMKKVKAQKFQRIEHVKAMDEIGQLTLEFNRMTGTIESLINEVYVADIQKKDLELKHQQAQLYALHSQINPHFLFNALESVRMRSLIKEEKETAGIIQQMAAMFRKSISWSRNDVTVREELELIQSFLFIQQYRFGDKLEYSIVADPAALELRIPKMVILPFVENASIHGIESSPHKGVIVISAEVRGDRLHFRLKDNGIGMSGSKLTELRSYLEQNPAMGERVGMKNAYTRLKLCYRDDFTFSIDAVEGDGTLIEISLPLELSTI